MKRGWGLILVLATTAGCAGVVTTQSNQASDPFNTTKSNQLNNSSSSHASAPPDPGPIFPTNGGPQPVLPVTGGPPVIGIPIGVNLYLPLTGVPPVVAIPLAP